MVIPRKTIFETPPLEWFTVDETLFEVRDETCWPIGQGQHSALEHYITREKVICEHINNILFRNNDSNELRKKGIETVKEIFKSPASFTSAISEWGLFGENGTDITDARKVIEKSPICISLLINFVCLKSPATQINFKLILSVNLRRLHNLFEKQSISKANLSSIV